jgi:hypothetical protein
MPGLTSGQSRRGGSGDLGEEPRQPQVAQLAVDGHTSSSPRRPDHGIADPAGVALPLLGVEPSPARVPRPAEVRRPVYDHRRRRWHRFTGVFPVDASREIKADVQDRYQRLRDLPVEVAPEGKLTRELARDPSFRMPVHLVVIDEFQEYFDLGEVSKEVAALLVYLVKVAPAAGVIVLGATQRPTAPGSGQVAQQYTSFRDNFQVRFSLRTGSWQVSDLIGGKRATLDKIVGRPKRRDALLGCQLSWTWMRPRP